MWRRCQEDKIPYLNSDKNWNFGSKFLIRVKSGKILKFGSDGGQAWTYFGKKKWCHQVAKSRRLLRTPVSSNLTHEFKLFERNSSKIQQKSETWETDVSLESRQYWFFPLHHLPLAKKCLFNSLQHFRVLLSLPTRLHSMLYYVLAEITSSSVAGLEGIAGKSITSTSCCAKHLPGVSRSRVPLFESFCSSKSY